MCTAFCRISALISIRYFLTLLRLVGVVLETFSNGWMIVAIVATPLMFWTKWSIIISVYDEYRVFGLEVGSGSVCPLRDSRVEQVNNNVFRRLDWQETNWILTQGFSSMYIHLNNNSSQGSIYVHTRSRTPCFYSSPEHPDMKSDGNMKPMREWLDFAPDLLPQQALEAWLYGLNLSFQVFFNTARC